MRVRPLAMAAAVAALVFPVLSAGPAGAGGGGGGLCSGFTEGTEIAMRDFCFQGVAHIAQPGTTITVTNEGQQTHNIVAVDGSFGIKGLQPGGRYEFDAPRPGVYEFFCSFHGSASGGGMAGVLVVEDGASLAAAQSKGGNVAPAAATTASASASTPKQPGSAVGWVALGALLLAGAALCVSLAVIRPRQT